MPLLEANQQKIKKLTLDQGQLRLISISNLSDSISLNTERVNESFNRFKKKVTKFLWGKYLKEVG
jgi:hypothetical protein